MRAALKVMRWILSHDLAKGDAIDVDGIAVTEVHDKNSTFALATVGNRVLVTNDAARMRAVLQSAAEPPARPFPELVALHREVRLDGEDAWGFLANATVGGLSKPLVVGGAAASFDVNDRDELAFRMAVVDAAARGEGNAFRGTREECLAVVSSFLPGIPPDAIEIDGDGARRLAADALTFTGRLGGLSTRFAAFLGQTAEGLRERMRRPPAQETPSATPKPPFLPQPSDPRSGTPAGPTHEGTPTPPR
jgi:hypothetical protein